MRISCTIVIGLLLIVGVDRPSALAQTKPAKKSSNVVDVKVIVNSEAPGYEGVNALDGDPQTMWHTEFGG